MESRKNFKSLCPGRALPKAVEFQYAFLFAAIGFFVLRTFSKRYLSRPLSEGDPHPRL
jgi:hypothetical protein